MPSKRLSASAPPRAWQRMLSGRRLDLLDPSPVDIEIEDIAHGLARVARWNGQTRGPHAFSVAQHSVLVADLCAELAPGLPARDRLAALLHDGPEYVIGDMISPFKGVLGADYKTVEARLSGAIHLRFGLRPVTPKPLEKLIKRADRISAWFEAVQLAGFDAAEADQLFGAPPDGGARELAPEPVEVAQSRFLARFENLIAEIDGGAA